MALIKEIETSNGCMANYHNLGVFLNKMDNYLVVRVTSWKDKAAKEGGKRFLDFEEITIPVESWREQCTSGANVIDIAYSYIKSLPKYEGATDDN